MTIDPLSDAKILDAWQRNAAPWTVAVRGRQIESRRLVTDQAIVDAMLDCAPRSVLDLGCGEGWLARALIAHAVRVIGVDAVPALVARAREAGNGDFRVLSYEDIIAGRLELTVDAVVCNFSLLGEASVENLLGALGTLLTGRGRLLIQTLHPLVACGASPYEDGWRHGSWAGFVGDFADPAPWYFRTLESWVGLLSRHGWQLLQLREPRHPLTQRPASVILIAQVAA